MGRHLYAAEVLSDSPLALWRCDDNSGASDSTANLRHANSITGTPTYAEVGPFPGSRSILLPTSSQVFRATVATAVTDNFTLDGWFKRNVVTGDDEVLFYNGDPGANGWGLLVRQNGAVRYLYGGVAFGATSTTAVLCDGGWHHFALVRRSGSAEYWIDGVQDATGGGTGTPNIPSGVGFGWYHGGLLSAWQSHLAIYATALSGTRITAHYNAGMAKDADINFRMFPRPRMRPTTAFR